MHATWSSLLVDPRLNTATRPRTSGEGISAYTCSARHAGVLCILHGLVALYVEQIGRVVLASKVNFHARKMTHGLLLPPHHTRLNLEDDLARSDPCLMAMCGVCPPGR